MNLKVFLVFWFLFPKEKTKKLFRMQTVVLFGLRPKGFVGTHFTVCEPFPHNNTIYDVSSSMGLINLTMFVNQ